MAPLVDYSDSDSDNEGSIFNRPSSKNPDVHGKSVKSKSASTLPPLPQKFQDLYMVSARSSVLDDPELHAGRQRSIPHVEGNWPTHIYLEWTPSDTDSSLLSSLIGQYQQQHSGGSKIHSLLYSELGVPLPLHISLSRPIVLKTEERAAFTRVFEDQIAKSCISCFYCHIKDLDWESNFDGTRWFLVLRVRSSPTNSLNRLLRMSNESVGIFNQPPLYQDPSCAGDRQEGKAKDLSDTVDYSNYFHVSIAWSLVEPPVKTTPTSALAMLTRLREIRIPFASVKVKIGNQIIDIPLLSQQMT